MLGVLAARYWGSLGAEHVSSGDLSILFIIIAIACFCIAAYLGYLGNVVGAIVVVLIGVLALIFGA